MLGCAIIPLAYCIWVFLACCSLVMEAQARMIDSNKLKQIAMALHGFHKGTGHFPAATAFRSPEGKPLLSWRVAVLPHLSPEAAALYERFRLDEPWDSPDNAALIPLMPVEYSRAVNRTDPHGLTHFQAVVGKGLLFDAEFVKNGPVAGRGLQVDIPDGPANTIMAVVAKTPVIWTKPEDIDAGDGEPIGPRVEYRGGHPSASVLCADGAVRYLSKRVDEARWLAVLTVAGGEPPDPNW
jgi:hypothetical protein